MKLYELFFISITWLLIAVDIIQARAGPIRVEAKKNGWSGNLKANRNRCVVDTLWANAATRGPTVPA